MPRSVIFYRNSALGRMSPLVAAARAGDVQEVRRFVIVIIHKLNVDGTNQPPYLVMISKQILYYIIF